MSRPGSEPRNIRESLIDAAYRQGKGGTLMNLMAITAVAWLHWVLSGEVLYLPWLVGMLFVAVLRGAIILGVAASPGRFDLATREQAFVAPLLLMSMLWASLSVLVFPRAGDREILVLAVIFAGMAGGASSVLASLGWPARFYLICMLGPASLLLLAQERHGIALGSLGFAYLAIILNAHRQARSMLIEAEERLERNRQLSVAADSERRRAEELNRELSAAQERLREQNASLERAVAERTEKMRLSAVAITNTSEGVMVLDARGTILEVNPAFTRITGLSADDVVGQPVSLMQTTRQDEAFYDGMWASLRQEGAWSGELWSRAADGGAFLERRVVNAVRDAAGDVTHYVAVFSDITEERQKDERIRHLAFHDALTGLPNRLLFEDRVRQGIATAARNGQQAVLMFIDLDQFKAVNDGLGHHVGDLLLQEVTERIRGRVRSADTLARLGGDEFVILLTGVTEVQRCAVVAREILDALEVPIQILSHVIRIGASIGISSYPDDGTDSETLMKNADTAMYAAKAAGRGTFRFFRAEMSESAAYRLGLESELRRAIEGGALTLHYQPKVSAAGGRVAGYEALLRWRNERHGMVPPADFIPIAEDCGLIGRIGAWTIQEACRQVARWHDGGFGWQHVAINVSARQILGDDVVALVRDACAAASISPSLIEIELTESVLVSEPERAAAVLAGLKALGASVAIDDFGTGYSSLAYLRRMPIDVLKIDRSFVNEAGIDANGLAIIRTILSLGKTLNMTIVAEGVETEAQAELLRSLGCDLLQGYLFARPQAPAAIEERWRQARPE